MRRHFTLSIALQLGIAIPELNFQSLDSRLANFQSRDIRDAVRIPIPSFNSSWLPIRPLNRSSKVHVSLYIITFRVSCIRSEMYSGHARLCVCLSVRGRRKPPFEVGLRNVLQVVRRGSNHGQMEPAEKIWTFEVWTKLIQM